MRRLWTTVSLLLLAGGCDSLVGGQCLEGYEYVEAQAACIEAGQAGGNNVGAGGEGSGGQVPITSAQGGAGGQGHGTTTTGTAGGGGGVGVGGSGPGCEPLADCGGYCIDLQSSPENCGGCGVGCPTGVCVDGMCLGAPAGHLVVSGFAYDGVSAGSPTARVLGNALVLHPAEPLRVLVPLQSASTTGGLGPIESLLSAELALRGRSIVFSHAPLGQVPALLDQQAADLFLVASPGLGNPASVQASLSQLIPAVEGFFGHGGVMVVLATQDQPAKIDALLAGFIPGLELNPQQNGPFKVVSWTDALAIGVISPFAGQGPAMELIPPDPQAISTVMESLSGQPVLLHRAIAPD